MQAARHFHLELRHASVPTYVASYLFPILLLAYEMQSGGQVDFRLRDELRELQVHGLRILADACVRCAPGRV
jgi:hypothetical protein